MRPVLLDSSILFPNVLRDTLLTLAEHDLFEPQWSTEILAEVRRNVIAQRSVPESAIDPSGPPSPAAQGRSSPLSSATSRQPASGLTGSRR